MTFYDARGELAEKAKQKKKQAGFSVRVEDEKFLQPIPVPRDAKIKKKNSCVDYQHKVSLLTLCV